MMEGDVAKTFCYTYLFLSTNIKASTLDIV